MNKPTISLTKTCSICGLTKPLSAFLELTGPEGTTYGNVCASCRKIQTEKATKEGEGSKRDVGGSDIGISEKVVGDIEREKLRKEGDELYHEERDEEDVLQKEQSQKKEKIAAREKQERETRGKSFLDNRKITVNPQQVFGGEQQTAKEKNIDLSTGPFLDTQIAGKLKFDSSIFREFKDRVLGGASPVKNASAKEVQTKKSATKQNQTKPASAESAEIKPTSGIKKR